MGDPSKIFGDWIVKDSETDLYLQLFNLNGTLIGSIYYYKPSNPLKRWWYQIPILGESSQSTKSEQHAKNQVFNRLIKLGYRYDPRMTNLL